MIIDKVEAKAQKGERDRLRAGEWYTYLPRRCVERQRCVLLINGSGYCTEFCAAAGESPGQVGRGVPALDDARTDGGAVGRLCL